MTELSGQEADLKSWLRTELFERVPINIAIIDREFRIIVGLASLMTRLQVIAQYSVQNYLHLFFPYFTLINHNVIYICSYIRRIESLQLYIK